MYRLNDFQSADIEYYEETTREKTYMRTRAITVDIVITTLIYLQGLSIERLSTPNPNFRINTTLASGRGLPYISQWIERTTSSLFVENKMNDRFLGPEQRAILFLLWEIANY